MKKLFFTAILLVNVVVNAQQTKSNSIEMVYTPKGLRPKADVHHVERTCHLSIDKGHIVKINNQTGKVVEDYGVVSTSESNAAENNRNVNPQKTSAIDSTFGSGWITYAYWRNYTGNPITYFSTDWVVPTSPVTDNGQTVFLFNGIDPANPSNAILQPVVQWGPSAAGGGPYWAITNWYVPATGASFWGDSLVTVPDGANLQGIMTLTGHSGTKFSYNSSFTGHPGCSLQIDTVSELVWANQTMEAYGITQYSDYPADSSVSMSAISIQTGTVNPVITWHPQNVITDVGQHCIVTSNSSTNGNVDLYFHTPVHVSTAGINTVSDKDVRYKVYPNPASNTLVLESQAGVTQNSIIFIKNVQGQQVLNEKVNFTAPQHSINVSDLSSGIYFLSLQNEKENYVQKIVIQK